MSGKEKFYDGGASTSAAEKRVQQLKAWESSVTNKQPSTVLPARRVPTIKFGESVIFLAAAHSGDTEEVERLVRKEGADVNFVNKDGLTALHQCCIDDDYEMVKTLVKLNANLDIQDKEGWTPLHAAASCGHTHIVSYLLEHGAFPALVNNEGDTPLDLAEDNEDIVDMLQNKIDQEMIDLKAVKSVEEMMMLEDANRLKNDPNLKPVISHGGATPLHVAAAKNYGQVVKILLSLKGSQLMVDAVDEDGWTALHAAVYWGNFTIAEQLVAHGADLDKKTNVGDTLEDLCEPELEDELNTLKKYGEMNNRSRSNAISTKPRLIHSNSREDLKHPSPQIVRRRSSKERSMFPKIDIAKEREERENFSVENVEYNSTESPPLVDAVAPDRPPDKNNSPPTFRGNLRGSSNQNATSNSIEARDLAKEKDNITKEKSPPDSSASTTDQSKPPSHTHTHPPPPAQTTISTDHTPTPSSSEPSSAAESPQSSPPQKLKNSPKSGENLSKKKYPGMSPKMLLRVGQWESQSNVTSVTSPSRNLSSGGRGLIPLASSTPSSNGEPIPRSATVPGPAHGQGAAAGSEGASSSAVTKRYSFQPKTISPSTSSSSLPPRSMSVEQRPTPSGAAGGVRGSLFTRKSELDASAPTQHAKRSSYDETHRKSNLDPQPEDGDYKASSLPRSAKISTTSGDKRRSILDRAEESDVKAVSTEAMATPSAQTDGSYLSVRGESRDYSREVSVDSNTSTRSIAEDSETSRKNRARKNRQTRKPTQPVPVDILEQITKHDQQGGGGGSGGGKGEELATDMTDGPAAAGAVRDSVTPPREKKQGKETTSANPTITTSSTVSSSSSSSSGGTKMSSFRPLTRPPSQILLNQGGGSGPRAKGGETEQKAKTEVKDSLIKSANAKVTPNPSSASPPSPTSTTPPTSAPKHPPKAAEPAASSASSTTAQSRAPEGPPSSAAAATTSKRANTFSHAATNRTAAAPDISSDSSPQNTPPSHSRTKSNTRRRPREKRRSTGIVSEPLTGEDVSEELAKLVQRCEPDGGGSKGTTPADDAPSSSSSSSTGGIGGNPHPTQPSPQSSISEDSFTDDAGAARHPSNEEMVILRAQLEAEASKNRNMAKELEEAKAKIMELNRRCQDATRAYEQERRENEMKDVRMQELLNNSKTLQELKHENQRMKDENSALIRVIGKLSRSPLPQPHT